MRKQTNKMKIQPKRILTEKEIEKIGNDATKDMDDFGKYLVDKIWEDIKEDIKNGKF
jgi:Cft2 family RNA processing exonuclease